MNTTPEFLDGPISQDYREILASASSMEAAPTRKAATTGRKCSGPKFCPKATTTGRLCSKPQICPKADALHPGVPGWSSPSAPLSS